MGFSRQPLHILNRRGNRGIVDRIDRDGYNAGIRQEAIADCEREAVLAREICIRGISERAIRVHNHCPIRSVARAAVGEAVTFHIGCSDRPIQWSFFIGLHVLVIRHRGIVDRIDRDGHRGSFRVKRTIIDPECEGVAAIRVQIGGVGEGAVSIHNHGSNRWVGHLFKGQRILIEIRTGQCAGQDHIFIRGGDQGVGFRCGVQVQSQDDRVVIAGAILVRFIQVSRLPVGSVINHGRFIGIDMPESHTRDLGGGGCSAERMIQVSGGAVKDIGIPICFRHKRCHLVHQPAIRQDGNRVFSTVGVVVANKEDIRVKRCQVCLGKAQECFRLLHALQVPAALPIPGVKISIVIRVGWIRAGALGFEVIGDHHKLFTSSNFLKFLGKGRAVKDGIIHTQCQANRCHGGNLVDKCHLDEITLRVCEGVKMPQQRISNHGISLGGSSGIQVQVQRIHQCLGSPFSSIGTIPGLNFHQAEHIRIQPGKHCHQFVLLAGEFNFRIRAAWCIVAAIIRWGGPIRSHIQRGEIIQHVGTNHLDASAHIRRSCRSGILPYKCVGNNCGLQPVIAVRKCRPRGTVCSPFIEDAGYTCDRISRPHVVIFQIIGDGSKILTGIGIIQDNHPGVFIQAAAILG